MSMPQFPPIDPLLDREKAIDIILHSIALEETALSKIIEAESDKIHYAIDRVKNSCCPEDLEMLLNINKSAADLLEKVIDIEIILKNKKKNALEYSQKYCMSKPPCHPEPPHPLKPPCHPERPHPLKPPCHPEPPHPLEPPCPPRPPRPPEHPCQCSSRPPSCPRPPKPPCTGLSKTRRYVDESEIRRYVTEKPKCKCELCSSRRRPIDFDI